MSIKRERLVAGFLQLAKGNNQYTFEASTNLSFKCTIIEHFGQLTKRRCPDVTWQELFEEFQITQSMSLPSQILGKRSSEVFLSVSRKYCIKSIDKETLQQMNQLFGLIMQYKENTKSDYLLDIYKVIQVNSTGKSFNYHDYYIIMPSIRGYFEDSICVYDIKGYLQARGLTKQLCQDFKFGKDQNFVVSNQLELLQKIEKNQLTQICEGLSQNTRFLQKQNIIDYSILISFKHKTDKIIQKNIPSFQVSPGIIIQIAIIDYFQIFNKKKSIEKSFKSLFRKQISSVEPDYYANRIIKFIQKYFLRIQNNQNPSI